MGEAPATRPPLRRDAARSRQAILDAAERLFAERGYERATMGEVASASGLSAGAPAYFFRSKEGLYRAVLGRAFEETSGLVRSWRVGGADFEQAVTDAVGSYVDFLAAHPNFVRLVIRDALEGGHFLQGMPEHLAAIGEALPRLAGELERGRLREVIDPAHLLLSGISLCWFPMVATALVRDLGYSTESEEFLEARKRQVSELLLRGAMRPARRRLNREVSR
jgi:AcrR family transcriptional regulator